MKFFKRKKATDSTLPTVGNAIPEKTPVADAAGVGRSPAFQSAVGTAPGVSVDPTAPSMAVQPAVAAAPPERLDATAPGGEQRSAAPSIAVLPVVDAASPERADATAPENESRPTAPPLVEQSAASAAPPVNTAATVSGAAEQVSPAETSAQSLPISPIPDKAQPPVAAPATQTAGEVSLFSRLKRGLGRTSENLVEGLGNLFLGSKEIDADLLEELESRLLLADVGVDATVDIIERLTKGVSRKELTSPEALQQALREELLGLLLPCEQALQMGGKAPFVILMVGVNGVGKTTTIGKLAKRYMAEGQSVMLAAGDTFRAAAVEQLQVWGERHQVPVIAQHTGADCASVLYDALQAAKARNVDVLIADTAGRLHNKDHLMEELKKVLRVMAKLDPEAPHEVMLVLDAGTGQNALAQAREFQKAVGVTGISLTKLDGTAKGGVIFAIAKKLGLPIRFIGVGEAAEDLRPFEARPFIDALFAGDPKS